MTKLADAHVEHIKALKTEGKKCKEIIEVIEKTYPGVKVAASQVYAITKGMGKGEEIADPPAKRTYKKHKAKQSPSPAQDRAIQDILMLLREIHSGYRQVFAYLRTELIKSRAEVYTMLTGAGIEPAKSEIE